MNVFEPDPLQRLSGEIADWEATEVAAFLKKQPERRPEFFTTGDFPVRRVYTAADAAEIPLGDIGLPGRYPFTRGPYPTMYRSRTWTMRQIAGFGTGEDTNRRFKYLIAHGQTGLSTDFDMPTLMGYDSDHPMSEGEVGREGVAVDTLADMEALFDGIDLEKISVSMTINPSAWILLAMYVALAEKRGYDLHRLSGTIQADILKEFMAQKEYIFPIAPSVRIVRDCIAYCAKNMRRYNPINISGYHISEAGSSPLHEAAFTLANLIVYVEEVLKTGMAVDEFAPRLAFFFNGHNNVFQEVAKFRAARRMWAAIMKDRFGATNPKAMMLRFHTQTGGVTLTAQQPMNNIMRVALQGFAAVCGGTQSLHTNGYDEALALPTERAAKIALRTQQVIGHESGAADTVDPFAGSYFGEALTEEIESRAQELIDKVDSLGGSVNAIEFITNEIDESAWGYQERYRIEQDIVVGVNRFVEEQIEIEELLRVDPETEQAQVDRLTEFKANRDAEQVQRRLTELRNAAEGPENLLPFIKDALRDRASMGEVCGAMKDVFGEYRPDF